MLASGAAGEVDAVDIPDRSAASEPTSPTVVKCAVLQSVGRRSGHARSTVCMKPPPCTCGMRIAV